MKKLITFLAFIATTAFFAQAPQGFNYQATVRNSTGQLLLNQNVLVKFNVLQNSATGTIVYSENQTVTTDDLGHINLVVGQGTATTGTFTTINWGTANYYLGIELNTGSGYVAMGTTQLLSVPYALYANSSGNAPTPTLANGTIFVGNVTNQATSVALSGDVTITNTGAATIANNAVTTQKIANANVTNAKLDKANIPLSGFGAATADVNLGTKKITNLADPINAQDAVTKSYSEAQLRAQVTQLQAQIVALQILASPTITNGAQIWSNTNLDVATYRDGTPIPQVTLPSTLTNLTTGAWCYYNNDSANGAIYGKLYNWYAVAGIHDNDPNTPNKILAPVGWHAPTNTEWTSFITFLGGEQVAGGKMKATGTTYWQRPNSDASNSSGFGGLPGGIVLDLRSSRELGQTGYWWSATESLFSNSDAFFCFMDFNSGVVRVEEQGYKQYFISVRLVRD